MTMITLGSGLGGFTAIAAQPTYGAAFVTPTRTLYFKSNKATFDPHIVQGGPYLAGGRAVDIGSAHVQTYRDAKGTLAGDMMSTGAALLLATAFGSAGKLTQVGTTTAYELGGSSGIVIGAPEKNNEPNNTSGCSFDMQAGVPESNGEVQPYNFHSCMITKGEWVFDRTGLVTYSYDYDAQYVETTTSLITPVFTTSAVPFSMGSTESVFQIGPPGSEATLGGVRKITIAAEHKLATDRIYLGQERKEIPVTNGLIDITVTAEMDYTAAAKTVMATFLTNEPQAMTCTAVGGPIGTSGKKNTLSMQVTNAFIQTGGEANLDGPDIVKNTVTFKGTINAANEAALKGSLITADSSF
jgi:Phage tail tube protein